MTNSTSGFFLILLLSLSLINSTSILKNRNNKNKIVATQYQPAVDADALCFTPIVDTKGNL